jgi:hypothetical protein
MPIRFSPKRSLIEVSGREDSPTQTKESVMISGRAREGRIEDRTMATYQVQVTGEWGGAVGSWRPAVTGTVNQSGLSDAEASTCDTHDEAVALQDNLVQSIESDPQDGDPRACAPRFRIVEVVS